MAIPSHELELETLHEHEGEQFLGGLLGGLLGEGELEGELEGEFEGEFEGEGEGEFEASIIRRVYPDAMMEHMAHEAMAAQSEHEAAEQFFPLIGLAASKLLPLAAKVLPKALPKIANVVGRVAPRLTKSIGKIARGLFSNSRARPLMRAVPTIANRTVANIARRVAAGQNVTPQAATRILRAQAGRLLRNRPQCASVIRRSRALDAHAHRVGTAQPVRHHCSCGCHK